MKTINIRQFKVLAIPFLALAVALLLLLSWGHQNAQQASADATTEIEFSIAATGCSTANSPEEDKCRFDPGSSFTLDMNWDGFSGGHAGDATNVLIFVGWSGAVSGPNIANGKSLTNSSPAGCDIPVVALEPSGDATRLAVACGVLFASDIATGQLGTAEFNCDSAGGTGTIVLENNVYATVATDDQNSLHWEDNAVDTLTINCEPAPVGGLVVDLDGDLGDLPLETAQSSSSSAGLLVGTVAGVAALAAALTGAAWYGRRRVN